MNVHASFALFFMVATSGCATVNRGTTDVFRIDTTPQGASVAISTPLLGGELVAVGPGKQYTGYLVCEKTPCALQISRRTEFIASVMMEGYSDTEIFISHSTRRSSFTGNVAANVSTGAASGATLGLYTGALVDSFVGALGAGSSFGSSLAFSTAAIGVGFGVFMIAVDQSSGATHFFTPNPVTLGLAEEGTPIRIDPNVPLFRIFEETKLRTEEFQRRARRECSSIRTQAPYAKERCEKESLDQQRAEHIEKLLDDRKKEFGVLSDERTGILDRTVLTGLDD